MKKLFFLAISLCLVDKGRVRFWSDRHVTPTSADLAAPKAEGRSGGRRKTLAAASVARSPLRQQAEISTLISLA